MPKKTLVYRDFSGGEVTSANPRTIKQNQLQLLSGMLVDEQGYLTTLYPPQKASEADAFKDATATLTKGRGLFYMKSDYSFLSGGNFAVTGGPFHYIIVIDAATGTLDISGGASGTKDEALFDMGAGSNVDFYFHNNILRIGDSNFVNGQFWFGPIGTSVTKKLLGNTYLQRWHSTLNTLPAPTYGLAGRVVGTGAASGANTTSIVPARLTDLADTVTGVADSSDSDNNVRFTTGTHGLAVGDTVILSGTEFYAGAHDVITVSDGTHFDIAKKYLDVAADETPEWRRKGDPHWFAGVGSGSGDIASAHTASKWFVSWQDESTDEVRAITSVANNDITKHAGTDVTSRSFEIYPYTGVGMNLDVYQSHGSDKGAWPPGDYEFGQTFVYEGDQESLITDLEGDDITIDANEVLYVKVLVGGLNVTNAVPATSGADGNDDLDPRLIGGRIYTRKSGTGDPWILLVDCDLRTNNLSAGGGTRLNLTDSLDGWTLRTGADTGEYIDRAQNRVMTSASNPDWVVYDPESNSPTYAEALDIIQVTGTSNAGTDDKEGAELGTTYFSTLVAGITYEVSAKVWSNSGTIDGFKFELGGTATSAFSISTSTTPITKNIVAASDAALRIYYVNASTTQWFIDDVSLKITLEGNIGTDFSRWRGFYSTQYTVKSPSPFTYEAINGFSQDEPALSFGVATYGYKTSVIANSRTFVANANYYRKDGVVTHMGDAILYSPPNKMDTFPPSNRLDIAEGDGDEFTCLMESGGQLLAFKESSLFIVDISNPNPAGWRLQGRHSGLGVKDICSAVKVESAVAFANYFGCWIYDNGQLQSLIDNKISVSQWQNWVGSQNIPNLGYDNISKKLIVIHDNEDVINAPKFYDLITGSWARGWDTSPSLGGVRTGIRYFMNGTESSGYDAANNTWSNFVTIPEVSNFDIRGHGGAGDSLTGKGAGAVVLVDEDDNAGTDVVDLRWFALKQNVTTYGTAELAGIANANRSRYCIVTRDEDFGAPNNIKKIYSVTIDYITETGDEVFNFDIRYEINGNFVTSHVGDEWLVMGSPLVAANQSGTGTASADEVNTIKIPFSSFSATSGAPIKCHSIALQIHTKDGDSGARQFVKILSIGMEYRIISKLIGTEATVSGDATI